MRGNILRCAKAPASSTTSAVKHFDPADKIKILSYSAYPGGFGNVMIVTMKLRNDNSFAVKDFHVNRRAILTPVEG